MVIFVILAGGELFGMLGILLALPVGSVLAVLARHLREVYQHSELYAPDDELESAPIVDPLRLDKIRKQREVD
jgi:predicted PurR-regulated permease PerM